MIGALGATARTVLAHTGAGDQIERAGPEPVRGTRQRAHRADLDGVAGEVRLERFLRVDPDLLQRTPLHQLDERIPRNLLGEPGAPRAQHTPLPVQKDLCGQRNRLGERALDLPETRLRAPVGHRLILQRALAALVAHRAVQRMIDQQQLHHPLLRLVGDRRRELGVDNHAVGDGRGAGGERLTLPLHVDEALTAGADRIEQRVVAEPRI